MSSLFLREDLASVPHQPGDLVLLTGDEARHATTVNRMRAGEHTAIGDGRGLVVSGVVTRVEPRELELAVETAVTHPEPAPPIVLVQALAKGDRDELAVQTATELGVSAVVPWQAERSVSRWAGPKVAKGVERWSSIVREAAKQSIRPYVPTVSGLAGLPELRQLAGESRMFVLEPTATARLTEVRFGEAAADDARVETGSETRTGTSDALSGAVGDMTPVVLVVGPEGGISPRELESLATAGARPVRLGPEVLRTSSAGPAALAVLNAALGRW